MELLYAFFQKIPMAALFLAMFIGSWVGMIKIGTLHPGGSMAGTLPRSLLIGFR